MLEDLQLTPGEQQSLAVLVENARKNPHDLYEPFHFVKLRLGGYTLQAPDGSIVSQSVSHKDCYKLAAKGLLKQIAVFIPSEHAFSVTDEGFAYYDQHLVTSGQ